MQLRSAAVLGRSKVGVPKAGELQTTDGGTIG